MKQRILVGSIVFSILAMSCSNPKIIQRAIPKTYRD
jgi:hypothetical protein